MPNKNTMVNGIPAIDDQVKLITFAMSLAGFERERIQKLIAGFNQYTSKEDRKLWREALDKYDRRYAELQAWLSALIHLRGSE